ncbi:hypothetical protein BRD00_08055 [Halobacteriales archaeon QS_8_69_26]|nr:MAG: hypothetical protein BRD00_08055 [Halobacteriales archaeon QS_8_69_26]
MTSEFAFRAWYKEKRSMDIGEHVIQLEIYGVEEEYQLEDLFPSWPLVPTKGRYSEAFFHVSIRITETSRNLSSDVDPEVSRHEFLAEVDYFHDERPGFKLSDPEDGTPLGRVQLHPDRLPDGSKTPMIPATRRSRSSTSRPSPTMRPKNGEKRHRRHMNGTRSDSAANRDCHHL